MEMKSYVCTTRIKSQAFKHPRYKAYIACELMGGMQSLLVGSTKEKNCNSNLSM